MTPVLVIHSSVVFCVVSLYWAKCTFFSWKKTHTLNYYNTYSVNSVHNNDAFECMLQIVQLEAVKSAASTVFFFFVWANSLCAVTELISNLKCSTGGGASWIILASLPYPSQWGGAWGGENICLPLNVWILKCKTMFLARSLTAFNHLSAGCYPVPRRTTPMRTSPSTMVGVHACDYGDHDDEEWRWRFLSRQVGGGGDEGQQATRRQGSGP